MPTAGMTDPEYQDLIRRIQVLHELLDGVRERRIAATEPPRIRPPGEPR